MGLALSGHNQELVHLPTGTPCWGGGTGVEFCASVGPTPLRALCRFPLGPPSIVDNASALSSIASMGLAVSACWPVERYLPYPLHPLLGPPCEGGLYTGGEFSVSKGRVTVDAAVGQPK